MDAKEVIREIEQELSWLKEHSLIGSHAHKSLLRRIERVKEKMAKET